MNLSCSHVSNKVTIIVYIDGILFTISGGCDMENQAYHIDIQGSGSIIGRLRRISP